ncbi:MAG: energy-coupling factor transporter transmembrane component T [Lachnospiraceae bacterium]|nr:energy-coupling factor transporter transmembrane component T [Lachnospiraceae bacterium]
MLRKITIGQYYSIDSYIHRLDPRVKLFATMMYVISLFVVNSWLGYLLGAVALACYIRASRVPFSFIVRGLKPIIFLLCFSVLFNLFLTGGGRILVQFWIITITTEGVKTAFFMAVRLVLLIIGSSIMTYTTTPNQLTDALEKSLGFLKKIRIPIHELAMMMSIALRFIPILVEETDKIMKAQMARGANFEEGNLIQRAKAMVPILVPLFISAFRRATDLALAMEARCYHGGDGRTKMKPLKYAHCDHVMYAVFAVYFAAMVGSRFLPL